MEIAKTINNFLELKYKINKTVAGGGFVGLYVEDSRRLITKAANKEEVIVLTDKLRVGGVNVVFDTPFKLIVSCIEENHSKIYAVELFTNAVEAVEWLTALNEDNEDDDSAEYDEEEIK